MTSQRNSLYLAAAAALSLAATPVLAGAQTASTAPVPAAPAPATIAYSSSTSANPFSDQDLVGSSLASAPDGSLSSARSAPQYGGGYGHGRYHRYDQNGGGFSHFAFEAGGGFTAPLGNDVSGGFTSLIGDGNRYGSVTWGGNLMVGAGWNFTKNFAVLGEFMYNDNKIPGKTLAALYNQDFASQGVTSIGGNVLTYSITAEPVFYYFNSNKHSYAGYVIGGGGWYKKTTNFTTPVESCDYFYGYCGYFNQTFSSFSDNAGGLNIGTGVSFKPFGEYSRAKLFAEARYIWVDTPRYNLNSTTGNPHTGTEELIPVTFGIRF